VVDRPQVDDLLEVPPAAFDLQQLLGAKREVLGRQVGSLQRSRYLPSRLVSAVTAALSMRSRPEWVTRR
jgi:hypothetical protein